MEEKKYHHGNLKNALVEEGINIVVNEGEEALSLRKVARNCNVSQAAPYAHFKDKLDLIHEMQLYVSQQFYNILCNSIKNIQEGTEEAIIELGVAYVEFFYDNPNYFKFLFQNPYLNINLSIYRNDDDYPPYELFRRNAIILLKTKTDNVDSIRVMITNMWATVQGLCLIATSPYVKYDGNIRNDIRRIIKNI